MYDSPKKVKVLEEIQYLWKLDDKNWVQNRKAEWKTLANGELKKDSAKDKKIYSQYYVNGRLEGYIGEWFLYLFTPYASSEEAVKLFYSDMFGPAERQKILAGIMDKSAGVFYAMPWYKKNARFFVEGVYGKTYKKITEPYGNGEKVISREPTASCLSFLSGVNEVLTGESEYQPWVEGVEYFVSALKFADYGPLRKYIRLDELMANAKNTLSNSSSSEIAIKLAKDMLGREQEIHGNWRTSGESIS